MSYAPQRDRLRATIRSTLEPAFRGYRSCALLDFLSAFNPGDALIQLGTKAYLREAGIEVVYEADWITFDARELRRLVPPGGLIVFHGGGNINSLNWKDLNIGFRLEVLETFRDRTIIQLPQSVFFDNPALEARARAAFSSHPSLCMFARDSRSKEVCEQRLSVSAQLCPDMALLLDPPPVPSDGSRVAVFRRDNEALGTTAERNAAFSDFRALDWMQKWDPFCLLFVGLHLPSMALRMLRLRSLGAFWSRLVASYTAWFTKRKRAAVERGLRTASVVVADRLHACIVCLLLDVPFVAFDNSYGKIHDFLSTWLPELKDDHVAAGAQEARALAERIAR